VSAKDQKELRKLVSGGVQQVRVVRFWLAPQKRVQLGRVSEMDAKQARTVLDDIVAALDKNPGHALGAEPVRIHRGYLCSASESWCRFGFGPLTKRARFRWRQ
jgi:hypothetical protein